MRCQECALVSDESCYAHLFRDIRVDNNHARPKCTVARGIGLELLDGVPTKFGGLPYELDL